MSTEGQVLRKGTQVRIQGFPLPMDPNNTINYNSLIGTVVNVYPIELGKFGTGYDYEIEFKNVEMRYSELDPKSRRLKRGIKVITARSRFHEGFLEVVALPAVATAPLVPRAPAIPAASVKTDKIEYETEPSAQKQEEVKVEPKSEPVQETSPQPLSVPLNVPSDGPPKVDPNTDMEALKAKIRAELLAEIEAKKKKNE